MVFCSLYIAWLLCFRFTLRLTRGACEAFSSWLHLDLDPRALEKVTCIWSSLCPLSTSLFYWYQGEWKVGQYAPLDRFGVLGRGFCFLLCKIILLWFFSPLPQVRYATSFISFPCFFLCLSPSPTRTHTVPNLYMSDIRRGKDKGTELITHHLLLLRRTDGSRRYVNGMGQWVIRSFLD